jgi:hypothetical protein
MSTYRVAAIRGTIVLLGTLAAGCTQYTYDPWARNYPPEPTGDAIPVAKAAQERVALEAAASTRPIQPSVEVQFEDTGRIGGLPGSDDQGAWPAGGDMSGGYGNDGYDSGGGGYDTGGGGYDE